MNWIDWTLFAIPIAIVIAAAIKAQRYVHGVDLEKMMKMKNI